MRRSDVASQTRPRRSALVECWRGQPCSRVNRRHSERGVVTVELVFGILIVIIVTALFGWAILLYGTQVAAVNTAESLARQAARGDQAAVAKAKRRAPHDARVSINEKGPNVRATVRIEARPGFRDAHNDRARRGRGAEGARREGCPMTRLCRRGGRPWVSQGSCTRTGDVGSPVVHKSQRGMGTMMIMAVVLVLLMLAGTVGIGGQYVVAKHRAQAAADLASLAGAQSYGDGKDGCRQAKAYATKNHRQVASCKIAGDAGDFVLSVRVKASVPHRVPALPGKIMVSAHAGPVRKSTPPR